MKFTKMHGCGNDYVLLENMNNGIEKPAQLAKAMCARRFGIGADGLLLVSPSEKAHFRMRMFNPDGSEAEMCGNGIRCFAKYVYEHGHTKETDLAVETGNGVLDLKLRVEGGKVSVVTVMMGEPILERKKIPVAGEGAKMIDEPIEVAGTTFNVTAVSMGNPHAIVFLDSLANFNIETFGPFFEEHGMFPKKINTSFVEVKSRGEVRVRTWERGAGLTMACGTGCSAVCVAGALLEKTDRKVHMIVDGGELDLEWRKDNKVYMTGPAVEVYSGDYAV
ncbi:MAG: diaminopimelate epimerase [Planctomycetota bacterium]